MPAAGAAGLTVTRGFEAPQSVHHTAFAKGAALRVHRVEIRNFRQVEHLDWVPDGRVVCLIGAGDAGKTTLLDAIEWCLWPRFTLPVSDADFRGLSVEDELRIEVTVADPPDELLTNRGGFDTHQRFIAEDGTIHDEPPDDTAVPALTVRLLVDDGLDPNWHVVCGERQEPSPIGARQRASLGVARLGETPDRDLRWGRGSALARLTGSATDSNRALAAAYREARMHLGDDNLGDLDEALSLARGVAPKYGAGVAANSLHAALDPSALAPNTSALGLHSGGVPLTSHGLATRRLLSLALQSRSVADGAIVLIDEVEHGLEPHRLRNLISVLRAGVGSGEPSAPGQVFMTTHSPTAVVELSAPQLHVVRRAADGSTSDVRPLTANIQGLVRRQPEALLAPAVIVAEGATEYGLLRGLDGVWSAGGGAPLAHHGVALADGGGHQAAARARDLAAAGYRVALLCDSDQAITPDAGQLAALGVMVVQWAEAKNTEERIAADLPVAVLVALLRHIADERGDGQVKGDIRSRLDPPITDPPENLDDWPDACGLVAFRAAAGAAMGTGAWIKRVDVAQEVGELIAPALLHVPGSDLAVKLAQLRAWAT